MESNLQLFQSIINHFEQGVIILNNDAKIKTLNDKACSLLLNSAEKIEKSYFKDYLNKDDQELFNRKIKSFEQFEIKLVEIPLHKNKEIIGWFDLNMIHLEHENIDNAYAIFLKDVTQKRKDRVALCEKIDAIELLSKSAAILEGDIDKTIYEIIQVGADTMKVARANAWKISEDKKSIECIGFYQKNKAYTIFEDSLMERDSPKYFNSLLEKEMILVHDTATDPQTAELYDLYISPNNIKSMMDIPIRIEGTLYGVVCFEQLGEARRWNLNEQKFALGIGQLISLAVESSEKQKLSNQLKKSLGETQILLKELKHRVKNNFSVINSLLNLQANKAKDDFHKDLLNECRNQIFSISRIHESLYQSNQIRGLLLQPYITELLINIKDSYKQLNNVFLEVFIDDVELDISKAIPLSLIINEVITNCYKHAMQNEKKGEIKLKIFYDEGTLHLFIKDNGPGLPTNFGDSDSLGMVLINALTEQLSAEYSFTNNNGTEFLMKFENPVVEGVVVA